MFAMLSISNHPGRVQPPLFQLLKSFLNPNTSLPWFSALDEIHINFNQIIVKKL